MLRRLLHLAPAACVALAACGTGEDGPHSAAPPGAPVSVGTEPRASVGVMEGDPMLELHRVVTPFLLGDGRLVVPVAGHRTIRLFSAEGAFITELGGPGEGPGEFASLGAAWARGDTIEAFDGSLRRITRFLPDRSFDVVSLDPVPSAQSAIPGALPDGWALMGVERAGVDRRDHLAVHHFARDGAHLGRVTELEGMARYRHPAGAGPHPLSPTARGRVAAGRLYLGDTLVPALRVLDALPEPAEHEVRWGVRDRPSVASVFRQVVDAAVAGADAGEADFLRERLEAAALPDDLSIFWDFMVDEEGFIWIRPYEPSEHAIALGASPLGGPGPGGEWLILSSEGDEVGQITIPDGLEPLHVTADAVVGIHRDGWDVESVRVHPLERSGGR